MDLSHYNSNASFTSDKRMVTSFVPPAAGSYYVTYRAFYEHLGTTLETSKQYTLKAY